MTSSLARPLLIKVCLVACAGWTAEPYDYKANPVAATDPGAVQGVPMVVDGVGGGSPMPIAPYTYLHKPGISHFERKGHLDWGGAGWTDPWTNDCSELEAPTPERPARLKLDYGKPVSVAKFALYFPRQGNMDGYLPETAHAAAVRTLELFRSDDGKTWEPAVRRDPLAWTCPQVVEIPGPRPARYYLFSFEAMAPGNTALRLYEIETYLDPGAHIATEPLTPQDPPAQEEPRFAEKGSGTLAAGEWRSEWSVTPEGVRLQWAAGEARLDCAVRLLPDAAAPVDPWCAVEGGEAGLAARVPGGWASVRLAPEPAGLRIAARMPPPREGERRRFLYLRIPVPGARVRFLPAHFWSDRPGSSAWPGWWLPTCMAAIQADGVTLALAPDTDRCRIGILGDEMTLCLFFDEGEASAHLLPVRGDWWRAYETVVRELDRFSALRPSRPATAAAQGILRWLMSRANWSEHWGNLRSFPSDADQEPERDFFFIFYGAPYGIPALWQRHVIAGDELAGKRARQAARFLLECPARVKEGPMKGGYYAQMGGSRAQHHRSDQAGNIWMTSHATGAALWALLYHRAMLQEWDPELDRAAVESADLLCRVQRADGGWHFAHLEEDGLVPSGRYVDSGTIWNIWALHKAGETFGESRYLEAARRGKAWWIERFLDRHEYTGYWEDSNFRGVIYPTREGYECSMAALAFLEMGDLEHAVLAARDLATWVHTRTPSYRTPETGHGNIGEQFTWPADFYLVPQCGFALARILEATEDAFWKPYAAIPGGLAWWVDEETGAAFFPLEASGYVPIHNVPLSRTYWVDWNGAQEASREIWWLLGEVNRSSGGALRVDPYLLAGTVDGEAARPWLPDGAVEVVAGPGGRVNWMGYKSKGKYVLAVLNDMDDDASRVRVRVAETLGIGRPARQGRRVQGGVARTFEPTVEDGGLTFRLPGGTLALLEWPWQL